MTATLPEAQCAGSVANGISTESSVRVAESKVTSSVATGLPVPPSFSSRTGTASGAHALNVKGTGDAAMVSFSQGMTDYRWCAIPGTDTVCAPSVQHRETVSNRIRLFGMPKGFPDTTAAGFQRFFYLSLTSSFVSNFASSIGYQSLLSGFFLGSSPQLWMLKDLVPALFAAYMANKVVSYESRPKFWFVVSVFINNLTVISDMLIPSVLPNHLLAAAIITSTVKQSSALMYFVTRASALQHYAINNNLAELTKKFNSFGMVSYTVATALGILYCTYIASFTVQLITVAACCVTNMFLSSMSMMPITFRLLNFDTMKLLLRAFILEKRRILTPQEISNLLGVRMLPMQALKKVGIAMDVATHLVCVSPPVNKLLIRSDTLEEDVLYVNSDHMFMLAMWKPSPLPLTLRECWQRYEFPPLPRLFRKASWRRRSQEDLDMEKKFHGRRLVLLVHQKCTAKHLIAAYLIMYTAVLQHADTEEELRRFVRTCHGEQELWHLRGEEFGQMLLAADWDVHLPLLDHHNFRMSELILPPSMRSAAKGCAA
ncbi:Vitamin B6 photo-protection and homoeostasis family protein [Leishmania donovani]|nr:Vitamin B6 photo-protection and homoeostasis family protein [Leishmania donovani]TPP47207.1 Vitamin B6 photo-protection and homoeostasis family protein [Leishmania donovani]